MFTDLVAAGKPVPGVKDEDWIELPEYASAMLCGADGSRVGIRMHVVAGEWDRVAEVADQVQDWVIDELWPTAPTNWPPCPRHPETHPLSAATRGSVAWWVCPADGTTFAVIGAAGDSVNGCNHSGPVRRGLLILA